MFVCVLGNCTLLFAVPVRWLVGASKSVQCVSAYPMTCIITLQAICAF